MTATNHAVTGAAIAILIGQWWAICLALVAHFVLDAIPHYGDESITIGSATFERNLYIDAMGAVGVAALIFIIRPHNWLLIDISAFSCASPDLMWLPEYIRARHGHAQNERGIFRKFHSAIQWYQEPNGRIIEILWFIAVCLFLGYRIVK